MLLAIKAVDQIEEDLGFEVGQLQLVDVVPEQVVRTTPDETVVNHHPFVLDHSEAGRGLAGVQANLRREHR